MSFETHSEDRTRRRGVDFVMALTLVLWLGCLTVAGLDRLMRDDSKPPEKPLTSQPTEVSFVDISMEEPPTPAIGPDAAPPDESEAAALQLPSLSPAPGFTEPVAAHLTPMLAIAAAPQIRFHKLVGNVAGGYEPPPPYPPEADSAGQSGTVVVDYKVDVDGHVLWTQVRSPSPWPMLDQSASRTIKESWSYPPGPIRYYEKTITFKRKADW